MAVQAAQGGRRPQGAGGRHAPRRGAALGGGLEALGKRFTPNGGAIESTPTPNKSEVFPKTGSSITGKSYRKKLQDLGGV